MPIHRRTLIKAMAGSATVAILGRCGTPSGRNNYQRTLSRRPFVAPRISSNRILRVITGTRPYRPSGFVVRRERIDAKTVVHNYGHGGGGISLSWGSSALAVREVTGLAKGPVAVIGSGIMGLTTARLLQDAGWQVTIYTRDTLRHTTSNVAGGQWAPTSVFEEGVASKAFEEQYKQAARISHHAYQNLSGADYGIRFIENYYVGDEPSQTSFYLRELPELFGPVAHLQPHQHPFPLEHVTQTITMMIEPAMFLRRVRNDFLVAGGKFSIQNFARLDEVLALNEAVIFNCTGIGSKALFGDDELIPIKGQLVLLPPDPAVDYLTVVSGARPCYMFPRKGEILLGGSFQYNDWSTHPEPEVTERIIENNKALFDNMRV